MSLKLFGSKYSVEILIWQRFFGCSDKEVDNLAHMDIYTPQACLAL
jgi:hypothetical protein